MHHGSCEKTYKKTSFLGKKCHVRHSIAGTREAGGWKSSAEDTYGDTPTWHAWLPRQPRGSIGSLARSCQHAHSHCHSVPLIPAKSTRGFLAPSLACSQHSLAAGGLNHRSIPFRAILINSPDHPPYVFSPELLYTRGGDFKSRGTWVMDGAHRAKGLLVHTRSTRRRAESEPIRCTKHLIGGHSFRNCARSRRPINGRRSRSTCVTCMLHPFGPFPPGVSTAPLPLRHPAPPALSLHTLIHWHGDNIFVVRGNASA